MIDAQRQWFATQRAATQAARERALATVALIRAGRQLDQRHSRG